MERLKATVMLCLLLVGCGGGGGNGNNSAGGGTSGAGGASGAQYALGGTIGGLNGTVVLQSNGGGNLPLTMNGSFAFSNTLAIGSVYSVTVLTQPVGQVCTIANGSGTVGGSAVTSVTVTCISLSANADLTSLTVSSGSLDQTFQTGLLSYTTTQPFLASSVRISAVAADAGATITVSGTTVASGEPSPSIALGAGTKTAIAIVSTAADRQTIRTYTIEVTRESMASFAQGAYVKASNTDAEDLFGSHIALSGDGATLAIGAFGEDSNAVGINGNQADNSALSSGAVYVFSRANDIWSQQAYLKASNTQTNDVFGRSLTLSDDGSTLAVGAYLEDSSATGINGNATDNAGSNSGAVYVFSRANGTWSQQAYVKASNAASGDNFGNSVALSGDGTTLAVGAWGEDSNATGIGGNPADNSAPNSGAVYMFRSSNGVWSQQAYVKASNTEVDDQFGARVALSGDGTTLAVGAWGEDGSATSINGDQADNSAFNSGAVYVFRRFNDVWNQQAYVKAANTQSDDWFAFSVALSGDGATLAVSALYEDSSARGVNGDSLDNSATNSGAVYVFTDTNSAWSQRAYLKASNTQAGYNFGESLALSVDGGILAVGDPEEASSAIGIGGNQADSSALRSGAVYAFSLANGAWSQQAYVKSSNTGADDFFGTSVALSDDAATLAMGTSGESSSATGIDGNQADNSAIRSGAVYIYQ